MSHHEPLWSLFLAIFVGLDDLMTWLISDTENIGQLFFELNFGAFLYRLCFSVSRISGSANGSLNKHVVQDDLKNPCLDYIKWTADWFFWLFWRSFRRETQKKMQTFWSQSALNSIELYWPSKVPLCFCKGWGQLKLDDAFQLFNIFSLWLHRFRHCIQFIDRVVTVGGTHCSHEKVSPSKWTKRSMRLLRCLWSLWPGTICGCR